MQKLQNLQLDACTARTQTYQKKFCLHGHLQSKEMIIKEISQSENLVSALSRLVCVRW